MKVATKRPKAHKLLCNSVLSQPEEAAEVVTGQIGHGLKLDIVEFAQDARHLDHVSGFIAFAAMWNRSQVRTIGLDQHARERDVLCHFA